MYVRTSRPPLCEFHGDAEMYVDTQRSDGRKSAHRPDSYLVLCYGRRAEDSQIQTVPRVLREVREWMLLTGVYSVAPSNLLV